MEGKRKEHLKSSSCTFQPFSLSSLSFQTLLFLLLFTARARTGREQAQMSYTETRNVCVCVCVCEWLCVCVCVCRVWACYWCVYVAKTTWVCHFQDEMECHEVICGHIFSLRPMHRTHPRSLIPTYTPVADA